MSEEKATVSPAPQMPVVAAAKPKTPQPLTKEETDALHKFIGRCVMGNAAIAGGVKFNVQSRMTIQDICGSSVETIRNLRSTFRTQIEKYIKDNDEDDTDYKPLKVGGILAEKWVNFFTLYIKKKKYEEFSSGVKKDIKALQASIAASLTPQEKRAQDEARLSQLQSTTGITASDDDEQEDD